MQHTEKQGSSAFEVVHLALSAALVAFAVTTYAIEGETALLFLISPLWLLVSLVALGIRLCRGRRTDQRALMRYVRVAVYTATLLVCSYYTALLFLALFLFGSFT